MGQKIHPVGFRVGVIRGFDSHWFFGKKGYGPAIVIDDKIRQYVKQRVGLGNVSRVEIERAANRIKVNIFTARPGAIIGRGGKGIDELTDTLNKMVRKLDPTSVVQVNVSEVRQPELDAQLVAENIAAQLEKRISHRRAMRQAMTRATRMNARGMKVLVAGRLNGAEIARSEGDKFGKIPLHTLRADIDYGFSFAHTVYGSVGVKVWIYKGDIVPYKSSTEDKIAREAAMAVGETSGQGAPRRVVSSAGRRPADDAVEAAPLIKEADPELEKLLDEEEEIARRTHGGSEAPHFRGED